MHIDNCNENTRETLMQEIMEYKFSILDLALYLNTHPDDEKALCCHKEFCYRAKELTDKYQQIYGPLTIECPCNSWRWLEGPWPWERGQD